MRVNRRWHKGRRAMAGIVATVFMFAMLFTVGASYFLFVNQNNMLYSEAASARALVSSGQHGEYLSISATAASGNSPITFTAENLGAATATVTSFFVLNSTGSVMVFCQESNGSACPTLPFSVNQGTKSNPVSTEYHYPGSGTFIISVITQLGNTFTATYPEAANSLAAQALSSGSIGDLYLRFQTYHYYLVASCSSTLTGSSGYCLGTGAAAFTIPASTVQGQDAAWSVTVTNLNPAQANITLDTYSLLWQFWFKNPGSNPSYQFFILNNETDSNGNNVILNTFNPVTIQYNQNVTLFFGSSTAVTSGFTPVTLPTKSAGLVPGTLASVYIMEHGWKGIPTTETQNYGQNSPYVTTLYD